MRVSTAGRYGLLALALSVAVTETAAQVRSQARRPANDSLLVIVTGSGSRAVPDMPSPPRMRSLQRSLTASEKAGIIHQAFPNGMPNYPKLKSSVDPKGLSKQVILNAGQMIDAAHTARLMVSDAIYRPAWQEDEGLLLVEPGGYFVLFYRPAKVGQPLLIECNVYASEPTHLEIKAWAQTAAVPHDVFVSHETTIAFVVIPTTLDVPPHADNRVHLTAGTERIGIQECAVTPLS